MEIIYIRLTVFDEFRPFIQVRLFRVPEAKYKLLNNIFMPFFLLCIIVFTLYYCIYIMARQRNNVRILVRRSNRNKDNTEHNLTPSTPTTDKKRKRNRTHASTETIEHTPLRTKQATTEAINSSIEERATTATADNRSHRTTPPPTTKEQTTEANNRPPRSDKKVNLLY